MLSSDSTTRLEIDMITTYKILHNLIDISMDETELRSCNGETRENGLRLIPGYAYVIYF